jgi:NADH dehydrogenase [ubiquinone] 1 alpha subcomplex assembly factor 7
VSRLGDELRTMIAQDGPITVERYMALALGHPQHGYYMTRDPFGAAGDFTTAPEISQIFGELLGLWAAEVWHAMGRPDPVRLIELGPGRGTLMADAVRASRVLPAFRAALDTHLVETSPKLRDVQHETLSRHGYEATWHAGIEELPDGPAIVFANEFWDALPIRQFVRRPDGLYERLVGLDENGNLTFGLALEPVSRAGSSETTDAALPVGALVEAGEVGFRLMQQISRRIVDHGGAILVIDYGAAVEGLGSTLQAVKQHRYADPLADPGEADLTAHVDFASLARAARSTGASVHGPVAQGLFLRRLGLAERAARLGRGATASQQSAIETAVDRLAGPDPGMGDLFKVLAVTDPHRPQPPGFSENAS